MSRWFGRWELRRSAIVIELLDCDGELRLRITGQGVKLEETRQLGYDHWTNVGTNSVRQGGPILRYNIAVRTGSGRHIVFHMLGGRMKVDWPERQAGLADGPDTFAPGNVFHREGLARRRGGSSKAPVALRTDDVTTTPRRSR